MPSLPPPIIIDGQEEGEVEAVVGHRETRTGRRYVVRFRGFGPEEDLALPLEELEHCRDLV